MSLIKRPNSRYWYVQIQIDGRTFVRSTKATDRKTALKIAEKVRADIHQELAFGGQTKTITFGSALRRYVESKSGTPNHRNLISHEKTILKLISGTTPLEIVTTSLIEEYIRHRTTAGYKPQTIKHGVNCIIGAINKARKDGYRCMPIDPPSIKVPNKIVRYLSPAEEHRLLQELSPTRKCNGLGDSGDVRKHVQDNYDLVVILLDTGARYSEISRIRWNQISLTKKSIDLWRPKVNNQSVLFMTDRVAEILQRRWESRTSEFVFTNKSGGPRGYLVDSIRKALNRAGLHDCTIHTLRHTHATRLIQNGLNLYEVQSVLGHSDIKTTLRYAHLEQAKVTQKARDVINVINQSPSMDTACH